MITVHHLGISQSERIVWLLEELGIEYKLILHTRDPLLSPDSLKSISGNETGKAPFIEDSDAGITLSPNLVQFASISLNDTGKVGSRSSQLTSTFQTTCIGFTTRTAPYFQAF
jgi:hypothetical protein